MSVSFATLFVKVLFVVFQIANAMATYRNNFEKWSDGRRIAVSMLVCLIPIVLILLLTYVPIPFIGSPMWGQDGSNLFLLAAADSAIKLITFVVSLAVISVVNVKTQKLTGNIWLGAFINTLFITMITVANCSSVTAY